MLKSSVIIAFIALFSCSLSYAQKNSLNTYKYVIIPEQFEFQKSADDYQVNSLTKFLFDKAGFKTYMSNETFPQELASNACLGLKGIVVNESGMFSTKMQIKLVDCYNNTVYLTEFGNSRVKEFKKSYHEAIRAAFEEIENLNYTYEETSSVANIEKKAAYKVVPVVEEVVQKVDDIQVVQEKKASEVKVATIANLPKKEEIKEVLIKPTHSTIEGRYDVEKWGLSTLSKTEEGYSLTAGDENFEFAVVYKTSKPNTFIIKFAAYKQPQLVELVNGNLMVDTTNNVKTYKRVN